MAVYFDSSGLVKLAVDEPESSAMRQYVALHRAQFSCTLVRTELLRAVRRHGRDRLPLAHDVLDSLVLIAVSDDILDRAAYVDPPEVRSLDAIHIAAALTLGDQLDAIVTYDTRMQRAARLTGIRVESPGQ